MRVQQLVKLLLQGGQVEGEHEVFPLRDAPADELPGRLRLFRGGVYAHRGGGAYVRAAGKAHGPELEAALFFRTYELHVIRQDGYGQGVRAEALGLSHAACHLQQLGELRRCEVAVRAAPAVLYPERDGVCQELIPGKMVEAYTLEI